MAHLCAAKRCNECTNRFQVMTYCSPSQVLSISKGYANDIPPFDLFKKFRESRIRTSHSGPQRLDRGKRIFFIRFPACELLSSVLFAEFITFTPIDTSDPMSAGCFGWLSSCFHRRPDPTSRSSISSLEQLLFPGLFSTTPFPALFIVREH